jgi:hypothetical protein
MRTPEQAVSNWNTRSGAATALYVSQSLSSQWKTPAASNQAEQNYASGVQAAVAAKSRQAGINASSDAVWQGGIQTNGQARYGPGITAAQTKMTAAMSKLLPAMATIRNGLPPRGPRGSSTNIQRSSAFQQALATQRGKFKASGIAKAAAT